MFNRNFHGVPGKEARNRGNLRIIGWKMLINKNVHIRYFMISLSVPYAFMTTNNLA
jgi:hypothetical protein